MGYESADEWVALGATLENLHGARHCRSRRVPYQAHRDSGSHTRTRRSVRSCYAAQHAGLTRAKPDYVGCRRGGISAEFTICR